MQIAPGGLEGVKAGKVLVVLIKASDQSFGRVVGQRDKRVVIGVDERRIMVGQAVENGFKARLDPNQFIPVVRSVRCNVCLRCDGS